MSETKMYEPSTNQMSSMSSRIDSQPPSYVDHEEYQFSNDDNLKSSETLDVKRFEKEMSPKPYDDLFIEPAGDYDVVYGDLNSTMNENESPSKRPYIRLNSLLSDITRNTGEEIRFKCEAAGSPLPLNFTWLKNHAPVEKNRRTKVKNREYWSRLIITDLDVFDSGYYQCIVSNNVASVNTTGVLRVNNVVNGQQNDKLKFSNIQGKKHSRITEFDSEEEHLEKSPQASSSMSHSFGHLMNEDDSNELWNVPSNAGGVGYIPISPTDRWLDSVQLNIGECKLYGGEACQQYLSGRYVMIASENREDIYDIDRNLRGAMMFINNSQEISEKCKQYSHAVACFHMYKVCDRNSNHDFQVSKASRLVSTCRKDCDAIQTEVCPKEFALAAEHDLIGDGPKALFPKCQSLNMNEKNCVSIINVEEKGVGDQSIGRNLESSLEKIPDWCYVDSGKLYEGKASMTKTGKQCMNWMQSTSREFNVDRYPNLQRSRNYCRNPGGKKTSPWCFALPNGQEEYCDVAQCPKNMYPHLHEREIMGTIDDSGTLLGDVIDAWSSVPNHWQVLSLCGISLFSFLIFLLCCMFCYKRKKKESASTAAGKTNNYLQSCNGSSNANSATNAAYYRMVNGTTPVSQLTSGGGFEMTMLPGSNSNAGYIQHQPIIYNHYSPHLSAEPSMEPYHIPEIQSNQLQIGDLIGENQLAVLHTGHWHGSLISGDPVQVVMKALKAISIDANCQNFEEEIRMLAPFDHPNVVRLLGVSYFDSNRLVAIYDYMVHGDLHDFLRLRAPKSIDYNDLVFDPERIAADTEDFIRIAVQIAYGMEYLASMKFVHRDLAARNCLVADQRIIKISNFGLFRSCYDKDYYKPLHRECMPVRWMSKESLQFGRFNEASDVWAFGVTLWEIYSYGKQPYEGYSNQEVVELISMRSVLECPTNCPTNIYSLMVECWHEHADRRPNFSELHSRLQTWSLTSPNQSVLSHQQNRANSSHSGSSGINRGSRQSSMTHSASLLRGVTCNASVGTAPSLSNTAFSVPSPAPVQTMMTLNGVVHPFHSSQSGISHLHMNRSSKIKGQGNQADSLPLMRQNSANYYSDEDGGDETD